MVLCNYGLTVDVEGGMNFTEAVDYCRAKGTYVGLPSSLDHLQGVVR